MTDSVTGLNVFVSGPIDYNITGTRRWEDLTGSEQDDYLLACFGGEAYRADAERRLHLFDRAAGSIADHLLGLYRQTSLTDGESHYEPGTPRVAADVLRVRTKVLAGSELGRRLEAAVTRREGGHASFSTDPALRFYSVAPATRGMDILDEACSGGEGFEAQGGWDGEWNDFAALHDAHSWTDGSAARVLIGPMPPSSDSSTSSETSEPPPSPSGQAVASHVQPPIPKPPARFSWIFAGPCLFASALLLWALYPGNLYGYYVLLRLVVCGTTAFLAVNAFAQGWMVSAWVLSFAALLYNPLVPVHLNRAAWSVINVATLGLLLIVAVLFTARMKQIPSR